VPITKLP
jgi:hypothetical protein